MSDTSSLAESLREKAYGHPELWVCTLEEFIEKVFPVLREHQIKNKLKRKVVILAAQFLRLHFDAKEMRGTIEYEVSKAIDESLIYYVNVAHEQV
jgi:hypothetical protein